MNHEELQNIKGIPASAGYVIAPAYVMKTHSLQVSHRTIQEADLAGELERFRMAVEQTRVEINGIRDEVELKIGQKNAAIFNVHLLILDDPLLYDDLEKRLSKQLLNIEFVFYQILQEYFEQFSLMEDPYIRERLADIEDVGRRVLKNLSSCEDLRVQSFEEPCVLVAPDILPSDVVMMHMENVVGFVTDAGSKTSHAAIVARSLKVPAIVGSRFASKHIQTGDIIIIDAMEGQVFINPATNVLEDYRRKQEEYRRYTKELKKLKNLPAETRDQHKVNLMANIELPKDVYSAMDNGSEGIGLFRTEFLYMNRLDLPSEEEHYGIYMSILKAVGDKPVVVRTLDVGGDKLTPQLGIPKEENPALGWRAIRYCLDRVDVFKVQLRALLRASVHGSLKIMFPMIAGLEELLVAKSILAEVKQELLESGEPFRENVPIGAMIETPSAAVTADLLASHVDFFSIGTNDLIQYTLAVDRGNEKIACYYDPLHPAIVRFIDQVVKAGHDQGIDVSMCGEMSSDPLSIELLIGLGLDCLSVSHSVVPEVKRMIRSVSLGEAQDFAQRAFKYKRANELKEDAKQRVNRILDQGEVSA